MLDISTQSEDIHKISVHLLLPTILIKNEKEQLQGVNRKHQEIEQAACKCLSDIEKNSSTRQEAVLYIGSGEKDVRGLKNLDQY